MLEWTKQRIYSHPITDIDDEYFNFVFGYADHNYAHVDSYRYRPTVG